MSHVDEFVSMSSEATRKARKAHRCCACGETILPGQVYTRHFTVFDGDVAAYKHCRRCLQIFREICKRSRGEPVLYTLNCGYSWEDTFGAMPADVEALAFALPCDGGPS